MDRKRNTWNNILIIKIINLYLFFLIVFQIFRILINVYVYNSETNFIYWILSFYMLYLLELKVSSILIFDIVEDFWSEVRGEVWLESEEQFIKELQKRKAKMTGGMSRLTYFIW